MTFFYLKTNSAGQTPWNNIVGLVWLCVPGSMDLSFHTIPVNLVFMCRPQGLGSRPRVNKVSSVLTPTTPSPGGVPVCC